MTQSWQHCYNNREYIIISISNKELCLLPWCHWCQLHRRINNWRCRKPLCFDSIQFCNCIPKLMASTGRHDKAVVIKQEGTAFLITIGIDLFHCSNCPFPSFDPAVFYFLKPKIIKQLLGHHFFWTLEATSVFFFFNCRI